MPSVILGRTAPGFGRYFDPTNVSKRTAQLKRHCLMERVRSDRVQESVGRVQRVDDRPRQRAADGCGGVLFKLLDGAGAQNHLCRGCVLARMRYKWNLDSISIFHIYLLDLSSRIYLLEDRTKRRFKILCGPEVIRAQIDLSPKPGAVVGQCL